MELWDEAKLEKNAVMPLLLVILSIAMGAAVGLIEKTLGIML